MNRHICTRCCQLRTALVEAERRRKTRGESDGRPQTRTLFWPLNDQLRFKNQQVDSPLPAQASRARPRGTLLGYTFAGRVVLSAYRRVTHSYGVPPYRPTEYGMSLCMELCHLGRPRAVLTALTLTGCRQRQTDRFRHQPAGYQSAPASETRHKVLLGRRFSAHD